MTATPAGRRPGDEDGQFLVMTVIFMTMFLALLGLVTDGGRYLNAKTAAAAEASQAARTGAAALDPTQLHAGNLGVDPAAAVSRAENATGGPGDHPGTAWVVGNTVYVRIVYDQSTQLLGIVGVTTMHVDVTEQATNVSGVS